MSACLTSCWSSLRADFITAQEKSREKELQREEFLLLDDSLCQEYSIDLNETNFCLLTESLKYFLVIIFHFSEHMNCFIAPGSHTPGPGAYKIGTTLGKSPATLIVSRHIVKKSKLHFKLLCRPEYVLL